MQQKAKNYVKVQQSAMQKVSEKDKNLIGQSNSEIIQKSEEIGISPYDFMRNPRNFDNKIDSNISKMTYTKVLKDLKCPICLCLLDNPIYIKSCLHRFCKNCIMKIYSSSYFFDSAKFKGKNIVRYVEKNFNRKEIFMKIIQQLI